MEKLEGNVGLNLEENMKREKSNIIYVLFFNSQLTMCLLPNKQKGGPIRSLESWLGQVQRIINSQVQRTLLIIFLAFISPLGLTKGKISCSDILTSPWGIVTLPILSHPPSFIHCNKFQELDYAYYNSNIIISFPFTIIGLRMGR